MTTIRMKTVQSRDGTTIAYERRGEGPPIVLVHGTTADHTRWRPVLAQLSSRFTVYAMDRRGRGGSGDADDYALELEFDDVAAVVEAAGPGATLVGHSYGALCAAEAALRTSNLRKLVLYEPVFRVEGYQLYEPGASEKLEAVARGGNREALLVAFLSDVAKMTPAEIEALRADPSWQGRLAAAHTAVREMADAGYVLDESRFSALDVPVLLLVGETTPPMFRRPSEILAKALPNSRIEVLPGQGHAAITTAPELFLGKVLAFAQD